MFRLLPLLYAIICSRSGGLSLFLASVFVSGPFFFRSTAVHALICSRSHRLSPFLAFALIVVAVFFSFAIQCAAGRRG